MFAKLLSGFLSGPAAQPAAEAPVALAAILVRLARADGLYSDDERLGIDRVLGARFGMSPFEAGALRREAEALEAEAADTVRFTRALKDAVPPEGRVALIEALWRVALSDGARDADEDALIRLAASLLGLTDRDSALARRRVEAEGRR
jgi:uncharacterized tellurite resistance protein B-like protein